MRKYFLLTGRCLTCSLVTCRYPSDSLNIPILPATYLSPPCLLPLWCYKITWLYSYTFTTIIPRLTCKMLQKRPPPRTHARTRTHTQDHTYCDTIFPGKLSRHVGLMPWPPCSPHLTLLDYSLWGFVKDVVYIHLWVAAKQHRDSRQGGLKYAISNMRRLRLLLGDLQHNTGDHNSHLWLILKWEIFGFPQQ